MVVSRMGDRAQRGKTARTRSRKRTHGFTALLLILSVAFMSGSYITTRYCTLMRVNSNDMENTLQTGDVVGCLRNAKAEHGDIVAFQRGDALMLKRIIAMEGDVVDVTQAGKVTVNGNELGETYLAVAFTEGGGTAYPLTVPEGEVFVAGDNRAISIDSRNKAVGTVSVQEIIAVAEMRVWPVFRFGRL